MKERKQAKLDRDSSREVTSRIRHPLVYAKAICNAISFDNATVLKHSTFMHNLKLCFSIFWRIAILNAT